jgi:ketosteroid isomerase-like protein
MSQENVEIVRAYYEAWNAGGWPEPGPFVGTEAVMREWEQIRGTFDADALEPISFIDNADRVVVRHVWRGAGHGPEVNLENTNAFMVRQGRIVYQELFWDHDEALEALGLSEQDAHADS